MPDRETTLSPAEETRQTEHAILNILLDRDEQRPWSFDEMVREIENPIATEDGLDRLHAAGLVHRCGDFVWATRAALRANEING